MEWTHYQNEMAKFMIDVSVGGIISNQNVLNTVTLFNRGSAQSTAPITAADVGSDTTVTIASHDVIYDATTISYNSGTITCLGFATTYFIYTDDPSKAGGAVTYVSTTTATDIVADKGRYYVGEVLTPADGAGGTSGGGGGGAGGNVTNGGTWP